MFLVVIACAAGCWPRPPQPRPAPTAGQARRRQARRRPNRGRQARGRQARRPRPRRPDSDSPLADLKKANQQLKKSFGNRKPSWSPEAEAKNTEIRKIVGSFLDFEELARRSLAGTGTR